MTKQMHSEVGIPGCKKSLWIPVQTKRSWSFDMWSVGVVWLELVLGTPHVFQVGNPHEV